jgi:hypothetical protein
MADKQDDILSQFAEFLEAKNKADQEQADSEDYEVEIWNEKGQGARIKRSHAKPFLQTLGIDIDPKPNGDTTGDDADKPKPKRKSTGNSASNTTGVARKYFTKPPTT